MKLTSHISQNELLLKSEGKSLSRKPTSGFDKLLGLVSRKSTEKPIALVQRGKMVTFKGIPFVDEQGKPIELQKIQKGKNQSVHLKKQPVFNKSSNQNIVPPYEIWREQKLSEPGKANLVHNNFKFLANEHLRATRKLRHGILTGKVKTPGQTGEKTDTGSEVGNTTEHSAIAHLITSARELTRRQIVREGGKFSNNLREVSQEEIDASLNKVRKTLNLKSDPRVRPFAPQQIDKNGNRIEKRNQNSSFSGNSGENNPEVDVRGKGIDPGMILGDNRTTKYGMSKPPQTTPHSANDSKLVALSNNEKLVPQKNLSAISDKSTHNNSPANVSQSPKRTTKPDSTAKQEIIPEENKGINSIRQRNGKSGDGEFPINLEFMKGKSVEDGGRNLHISTPDPVTKSASRSLNTDIPKSVSEQYVAPNGQHSTGEQLSKSPQHKTKNSSFQLIEYESVEEKSTDNNHSKVVKAKTTGEKQEPKTSQPSDQNPGSSEGKSGKTGGTTKTESESKATLAAAASASVKPQTAKARIESLKKKGWRIHTPNTVESVNNQQEKKDGIKKKSKIQNVRDNKESGSSENRISNSQLKESKNAEAIDNRTDENGDTIVSTKETSGYNRNNSNATQQIPGTSSGKTISHQAQQTETRLAELENLKEILQKIEGRAKIISNGGTTTMQVRLIPKNLGLMHVQIHQSEGRYEVSLRTNSPEAAKAIESQIEQIKTELSNNGIQVEKLNVSTDGSRSNGRQSNDTTAQSQSKQDATGTHKSSNPAENTELETPITLDLGTNSVDFIG